MIINRAETVILAILEFVGLLVAVYGLWFQYASNVTTAGIIYCTVWYILGGVSHLLGLISICLETMEDELKGDSQAVLQFHYLTGWLSVVFGYPLLVTFTWMMLKPDWAALAQGHLFLCLLPIVAYAGHWNHGIVRTTQLCTGITAISHFIVCTLAQDYMGVAAAAVMTVNIIALSTPTRYHIWAFNSRELFIVGLVATSILMNISIVNLGIPLQKVRHVPRPF